MSRHVKENCEHKHEYKSDLFQLEFDLILDSSLYYVAVRYIYNFCLCSILFVPTNHKKYLAFNLKLTCTRINKNVMLPT